MRGRPRVFLATLGPLAAFGPRATYATNVFAAAGLAADASPTERDVPTLVADFAADESAVACICGTDAAYAAAGELAAALHTAGAHRIFLVGTPTGVGGQAGIDAFLHDGCDALAILADALEIACEI